MACVGDREDARAEPAIVGGDELGRVGHLLQVRAFAGEQFYSAALYDNPESVDGLGERSYVAIGDGLAGVDLQFVQAGVVLHLNYSVINIGVEGDRIEVSGRADDVVHLARQAADRM